VTRKLSVVFVRFSCATSYLLEDDVPADVKQDRANEIMEIQSQISWDLNQLKLGQTFKCIIDRKKAAIL
jgi:ribosomal protein S12 methylthiotransferase